MKNTSINFFSSAIVISGIELLQDFNRLNLFSLQALLANMEFYFIKMLSESRVFLYSSKQYDYDCTTLIFLVKSDIQKVRYLNANIEKMLAMDVPGFIYHE